jgi:hypothetical protein
MPKTGEHPMATKREEITHVLEQAGEEDIEIIYLTDEMVIHIKTAPKPASPEQKHSLTHKSEKLSKNRYMAFF